MERYKEAIPCLKNGLGRKNSDKEEAWLNMAMARRNLGEYGEALKCFNKALRINPKSELARQGLRGLKGIEETIDLLESGGKTGKKYI
jgi:tetratricopeptide (TPR) repeat protein